MLEDGGRENPIEVPMLPPILTEEEIQSIKRMRKHVDDFIHLCLRTNKCEPNDTEVKVHLDLRGRLDPANILKSTTLPKKA